MSTGGVQVAVEFKSGTPFTDEWVDGVYSHLEEAMTIVSVDMGIDEPASMVTFLLGIDAPEWCADEDSFSADVAVTAIRAAIDAQELPGVKHAHGTIGEASVRVFA